MLPVTDSATTAASYPGRCYEFKDDAYRSGRPSEPDSPTLPVGDKQPEEEDTRRVHCGNGISTEGRDPCVEHGATLRGQTQGRPSLYDEAARTALMILWEASDRVGGKRLRALLPILVPALERHGRLKLDNAMRAKVLAMSASTIDRLLRMPRSTLRSQLLEEIRAVQARLVAVADGDKLAPPAPQPLNLSALLAGLSSACRAGEVRPTFSPEAKPRYLRSLKAINVAKEAPKRS
jgi:hypothetical protein